MDDLNNDIIVTYFNKITELNSNVNYHSFLQRFKFTEINQMFSIARHNFNDKLFLNIGVSTELPYKINGSFLKLVEETSTYRKFNCIFYVKNMESIKTQCCLKQFTFEKNTFILTFHKFNTFILTLEKFNTFNLTFR